jgi:uncharacterized phage protein (TIGR01671 family)
MRDIKFRAWDKENKKMLTGQSFILLPTSPSWGVTLPFVPKQWLDKDGYEKTEYFDCMAFDWADGNLIGGNYELMQYIGEHDKNGVEIYEGDIVEDGRRGLVVYDDMNYMALDHNDKDGECQGCSNVLVFPSQCIVIGNKWQNPELLR